MQWFYLAGILFLGVLGGKADEEFLRNITKYAEDYEDAYTQIKSEFEIKCREHGSKDSLKNLTKIFDDLRICVEKQLPYNTDIDSCEQQHHHICTHAGVKIRECFSDFVEVWKDCSEPKEKYLPHFVFDAAKALLDLLCADYGAFATKMMNSFDCIFALLEYDNIAYVCYNPVKFPKDMTPADIRLTKEELCEELAAGRTCFGNLVQEQCYDSEFKDVVDELYYAVSIGCDKRHRRSLPLSFRLL